MTGINIYTYGLCFLVVVQFLIGFIHIILLYNTYRPILMNNCIQRQPSRFFWWSENYAENERFKETFDHCYSQWTQFSTERLVSWVVYSVASVNSKKNYVLLLLISFCKGTHIDRCYST